MLWVLRFKRGIGGVTTGFLETKGEDFARAEQVGKAYCEQNPSTTFIRVERAILADESVLKEAAGKPVPAGSRIGA